MICFYSSHDVNFGSTNPFIPFLLPKNSSFFSSYLHKTLSTIFTFLSYLLKILRFRHPLFLSYSQKILHFSLPYSHKTLSIVFIFLSYVLKTLRFHLLLVQNLILTNIHIDLFKTHVLNN